MKVQMFSVYDSKAEAYLQPFFAQTRGVAMRMFQQAATDTEHNFCKHAEDYTLFFLGEFDDSNGNIESWIPETLGNALTSFPITNGRADQVDGLEKQNGGSNAAE